MTNNVLEFIAAETNGKCYQSFRYCADEEMRMPTLDYEDKDKVADFRLEENSYGEILTTMGKINCRVDKLVFDFNNLKIA